MDQTHNLKIKRTALNRACEELARKHPAFRLLPRGPAGGSYGYAIPQDGDQSIGRHFNITIGDRTLLFRGYSHINLVHIPPYASKKECLGIIRVAMRQADTQMEMERAIANDKAQGTLL
jgi:hypothetical protein